MRCRSSLAAVVAAAVALAAPGAAAPAADGTPDPGSDAAPATGIDGDTTTTTNTTTTPAAPDPDAAGATVLPGPQQSSAQSPATTQGIVQTGDNGVHVGDTYLNASNTSTTTLINIQVFNTGMIVSSTSEPATAGAGTREAATADAPVPGPTAAAVVVGTLRRAAPLSDHYLIQTPDGELIVGTVTDPAPLAPPSPAEPEPVVLL